MRPAKSPVRGTFARMGFPHAIMSRLLEGTEGESNRFFNEMRQTSDAFRIPRWRSRLCKGRNSTFARSWAHDIDPAYVMTNLFVHLSSSRISGMNGGSEGPQLGTRWTRSAGMPFETTC